MAAIALISSIGLLISDRNFYTKFSKTPITLAICAGIWLVAFAIISPIIFDINLFGENFGQFGWNPEAARCGVTYSENVGEDSTHRKVIFACGVIVPFLVISVRFKLKTPFRYLYKVYPNPAMVCWAFSTGGTMEMPADW